MTALRGPVGGKLELATPSDTALLLLRSFAAPPALVYEAFTRPELISQWLLGPDGWTMPVCEMDVRPGGGYRYLWRKAGEPDLELIGEFVAVTPPHRLVAREGFEPDWTSGTTTVVTEFEAAADGGTLLRMTIEYVDRAARDAAARTGMAEGMETGYQRLDAVLWAVAD